MRRIKKVRPMEVSLCNAAANRRVFGLYKSQTKPEGDPLEDIRKGGPGSGPQGGGSSGNSAQRKADETHAKAHALSQEAHQSNEVTDHRAAAEAHREAGDAARAVGDKVTAKISDQAADYHADRAEALDGEELGKGGPGSGPQKGGGSGEGGKKGRTAVGPDGVPHRDASAEQMTHAAENWSRAARAQKDSDTHRDAAVAHRQAYEAAKEAGNRIAMNDHDSRASQHEAKSAKLKSLGKTARGSNVGATLNIQDAISNTDPKILKALGAVAKSVGSQDGRGYTPQAASIIKAVGRLLAPFAEELTLSDLQAVGKAAGLGATAGGDDDETAPAFKSVAKPGDDEDELEDDADTQAPDGDDVPDDEEVEDEYEDEDDDEEETEEEAAKSARTIAAGRKLSEGMSKSKAENESEEDWDEEDDDEDEDSGGSSKAPPFGQPKGAKAKGGKVAKAAHAGHSVDARIDELMMKHRQLAQENKALREGLQKSRTDLDAERDFRQLEAIKKSIREDYGHLGLDEAKFAPVLKRAKDAEDQAHYEELTSLLKSCNEKVRGAHAASGIFEAVGKSTPGANGSASWADRIEARVDEEMKKSAPGVNRAVVYDRFIQTPEGREMRKNHRLEKGRL